MLKHEFARTASVALLAALLAGATALVTLSAFAAEPVLTGSATGTVNSGNSSSECHAQLAAIHTEFPQALQSRGAHGNVLLKVTVAQDGRATATQVAQSSGYTALDKAAADSVTRHWRFAVSHCASTELPADALVTVKFQRAPRITVYGTRNTRRVTTNSAQAQINCDTTRTASGDQIVACLADASLAGRNTQPTMANRAENLSQRK